jgi:retinol-binding protein 3
MLLRRGQAAGWIDQTFDERGIPMSNPPYRPWADDCFRFDPSRWTRKRPKVPTLLLTLFLLWPPGIGVGQTAADPVEGPERAAVIERMASLLEDRYVFPDLGGRVADSLRLDERSGTFEGIHDPEDLAAALSERIRTLSGDGHLWVMVHVEPPPETAESPEPEPSSPPAVPVHLQRANFGFPRAEILPGNVGYLDVRQFVDPTAGGATAAAAMTYLGNTEAFVLDLRRSMGGSQAMVALLASWFLEEGSPVHLFDSYHRPSDRTDQHWTLSYLPTPRLAHQPLFVLTAERTFSAGEGLAYVLKHLERATIVGETTGGGANPGDFHRLNARFMMFVAEARVTSPVTGANWEDVGVQPHVSVVADAALEHAHRMALEALKEVTTDDERRRELEGLLRDRDAPP